VDKERQKPDRDRNLPIEAHGSPGERGNLTDATAEYDTLLSRYAEEMQRIGQLEAQVESLNQRLVSLPDAHESSPIETGPPPPLGHDETSQLRIQITTLAGQLARTQEQLAEIRGTRVRRRRSRDRPPGWKFWRRSNRY
jgi:hypothetical protein